MIYLLRHAQTEWNTEGRKQGQGNSPLTERGRSQAQACALLLSTLTKNYPTLNIYSSPLGRAKETAEYVVSTLNQEVDVQFEDALMELNYGAWEGFTNEEIDVAFPGERKIRNKDRWNYVLPGGESYAMVAQRIKTWITSLHANEINVVITHDMVSRVIRGLYLGLDEHQTLQLKHPHDCIFQLSENRVKEHL